MELNHLRAVLAVARLGSFTFAARELFLSQPTVSRHVAAVEREVGQVLFLRHARSVCVTAAGEAFLPYAEAVVQAWQSGLEAVAAAGSHCARPTVDVATLRSA